MKYQPINPDDLRPGMDVRITTHEPTIGARQAHDVTYVGVIADNGIETDSEDGDTVVVVRLSDRSWPQWSVSLLASPVTVEVAS